MMKSPRFWWWKFLKEDEPESHHKLDGRDWYRCKDCRSQKPREVNPGDGSISEDCWARYDDEISQKQSIFKEPKYQSKELVSVILLMMQINAKFNYHHSDPWYTMVLMVRFDIF